MKFLRRRSKKEKIIFELDTLIHVLDAANQKSWKNTLQTIRSDLQQMDMTNAEAGKRVLHLFIGGMKLNDASGDARAPS